jgi:hypothetical protein
MVKPFKATASLTWQRTKCPLLLIEKRRSELLQEMAGHCRARHGKIQFTATPNNFNPGVNQSMSEQTTETAPAGEVHQDEVSYHAVEKNGKITAIWEMRGRKHVRTIDPRSAEGRHLLGHTDNAEAAHNAQA